MKKNRVSRIHFVENRGLIINLAALKRGAGGGGGAFGTHIRTMPYMYSRLSLSRDRLFRIYQEAIKYCGKETTPHFHNIFNIS